MQPQTIDHRYRVKRPLGEGLSGEVYLVEGPEGAAALKLLKPFSDRKLEESLLAAFKFEFGLLKDFNHPHVVQIRDFGFDEPSQRFYFTEEYLAGRPISEYCSGATPDTIEALFAQALHGLQALHRAHIIHGDLQANNLLVVDGPEGGVVKIIDLGLADPRFPFTAGTPSTMAPEKILKDPVDERADLYSLGVIFYQLLSGENPFVRGNLAETYEAHLTFKPPKLTLKNPRVPVFWNELLAHLLAKNPAHRFRNCGEVLEALDFSRPKAEGPSAPAELWRPESWVVRPRITEAIAAEIRSAHQGRGKPGIPSAFLITGESGVGKSRLVQEIKYLLQMEQIRTFESRGASGAPLPAKENPVDLWIVDDWPSLGPGAQRESLAALKSRPCLALFTGGPDSTQAIQAEWKQLGRVGRVLNIPPFSPEDFGEFLQHLTGLRQIPQGFSEGLFRHTHGNPKLAISLLQNLARQKRLVDANGRWNLAIFGEGEFELTELPMDLSEIDRALEQTPGEDAEAKARLWILRAEELLKRNQLAEGADSLKQAEEACGRVAELPQRFHLKARILERNGYRLIREGRYETARQELEKALTLLSEGGIADTVLSIRVNNFRAWLACQEGRLDEAIETFREQHERWKAISPEDQARILNNDLGFAYLQKGDAPAAIRTLTEYLPFYRQSGDAPSLMKAHYNLAEAHLLSKNYSAAIEQDRQAASLARQERNYEFLLRIYNGLGKIHHLQGDLTEALSHYQRALELARYLRDFSSAAAIAQNIGSIQKDHAMEKEAEENFAMSIKMIGQLKEKSAHDKYLLCRALLEWGDLFRLQGRYEEAMAKASEANQIASAEEALASFRFWVAHTLCKIEKDRGRVDRLQDQLAELLPLADDPEKKAACEEFLEMIPRSPQAKQQEANMTRREDFRPSPTPSSPNEFQALMQVARWMASEADPERLLSMIVRQAVELSGAEAGWILLEEKDGTLAVQAAFNCNLDEELREMSEGVAREVLRTGEAVNTGDALNDPRFNLYQSVIVQHLQSILALPIRSPLRLLGVLALTHRHRSQAFETHRLELLKAFADQAGIALEQARLVSELKSAQSRLQEDLAQTEEALEGARRALSESSLIRRFGAGGLVGHHPAMVELFDLVERIKDTPLSVLLQGESGTGKERIARYLHERSRRAKGPFIAVNCAALPAHLIESELFGYNAGAFTGASRDKKGLIAEAGGGTLFLDEISELELPLQAKLLRVLQEREITRLGDTRPTPVDFRLVSATHRRLKEWATQGKFREDLFYRCCEIELNIPPLRQRSEDIPLLAESFAQAYLEEHGEKGKAALGRDLLKALMDYAWPGNVRELENVIRVATALKRGSILNLSDLPNTLREQFSQLPPPIPLRVRVGVPAGGGSASGGRGPTPQIGPEAASPGSLFNPEKTWEEMELTFIASALLHHEFDVIRTAKALACAPSKLYQRLKEHRIQEKAAEWRGRVPAYRGGTKLDQVKKEIFQEALKNFGGSPYETARRLGVSPGMVYKWTEG